MSYQKEFRITCESLMNYKNTQKLNKIRKTVHEQESSTKK